MHAYQDVPTLPHTFRGALAFNQRTVSSAVDSLLGDTRAQAPASIPLSTLTSVLLLLESIATSSAMCLDGTLPPPDLTKMESALARARERSGVPLEMEFLKPPADTLVAMFKSAADVAALLIQEDLESLNEQSDEPLNGKIDIAPFVAGLQNASDAATANDMAMSIAQKAAEGVETFRGSKCLAGLILAEQDPIPLVKLAADAIVNAPEATQRKAIAVLINRFRINYVNNLATLRDAAYLADRSIEDLKSQQVVAFGRYFADKIAADHRAELSVATRHLFDRHFRGAPLGFAILMNSRGKTAVELLEEAKRIRSAKFAAAAARATPQNRFLHQFDETEFSDFQDYLFQKSWSNLLEAVERKNLESCAWRTIQSPGAIAGIAVAAAASMLLFGPFAVPAGAFAAAVIGNLTRAADDPQAQAAGNADVVQIDQYRKLDTYFASAAENDRVVQVLSDRVEMLFGRPLDVKT